ncbi:MAG: polysaccharide biosynthesis C-terminal domain-containing protein [Oscillospiraceae bacterium]|nr:polysaccharide biosynthesis C-terminal domain-containing protein [Oscillospiraceae bacterium]
MCFLRCFACAIPSITRGYLQGHKVITPSSRSQLIEQVVRIAVIIIGSFIVIKVANGTVKIAIGIAMTGAFFAGVAALIYLKSVMRKNKKELFAPFAKVDSVSNKEIASKVISYAIPFVIISVVTSIYTFTDQILVLRTLNYLEFDATDVEFAASAISTWSPKIGMIISSVAMGMAMNLIPAITSSYATKNMKDVQNKINKSVSIMLFVSVPMAIGLAVLSKSVWTVFYGPSTMGPQIMALAMFVTVAANVSNTVSVICQSLSKYKLVYGITFVGFILNAALDVPVMLLFSKIGIPAYLGSLAASLIGYTSSSILGLAFIKKTEGVKYGRLRFYSILTIMPSVLMAVVIWPLCHFLPFNQMTTGGALLTIIIVTIVGVLVYGGFVLWSGFAKEILGEQMMNRITSKFSRLLKRS